MYNDLVNASLARAGGWEFLVNGMSAPRFYNLPPERPQKPSILKRAIKNLRKRLQGLGKETTPVLQGCG